jgi:hypothetical protein
VLTRLIDDGKAINEVAKTALGLMHFENVDAAIAAGDAGDADLLQEKKDGSCVRGCYRCLLSYFSPLTTGRITRGCRAAGPKVQIALGHCS